MAAKKKPNTTANKECIHICYICGKEIYGEHIYIKTKRGSELRIHNACIPIGRQDGRD